MAAAVDDPLLALLPKARRRFARTDPLLAKVLKENPPTARSIEPKAPFAALVESITHQQVSLAAGRTIYSRVAALGSDPASLLKAGPDALRAAGLSRPKVSYVLDLASRDLDFTLLATADDERVIETLTEVKGIGVWTAKMFLIFHLHRPDVSAHEDLGLQIAVSRLYDVSRKEAPAKMKAMRDKWAPYNSVTALSLWHWRHAMDAIEADALSRT